MMNKAKRILELARELGLIELEEVSLSEEVNISIDILRNKKKDELINLAVEVALEVERDYVRKDRLLDLMKTAYECGHNDTVESSYSDAEDRCKDIFDEAINSGELGKEGK